MKLTQYQSAIISRTASFALEDADTWIDRLAYNVSQFIRKLRGKPSKGTYEDDLAQLRRYAQGITEITDEEDFIAIRNLLIAYGKALKIIKSPLDTGLTLFNTSVDELIRFSTAMDLEDEELEFLDQVNQADIVLALADRIQSVYEQEKKPSQWRDL